MDHRYFFPLDAQRTPENDESRIIISQPFIDNWSRFNTKWLAFSNISGIRFPLVWGRVGSLRFSIGNQSTRRNRGEKTRVSLIFLDNLSHSSSPLHFSSSMIPHFFLSLFLSIFPPPSPLSLFVEITTEFSRCIDSLDQSFPILPPSLSLSLVLLLPFPFSSPPPRLLFFFFV